MNPKKARELYEERNKCILNLYNSGMTLKELGKQYNISKERVRQILEKQQKDKIAHYTNKKIKSYNKTRKELDLEFVKEARLQHKSWDYICKALHTYYYKLKEHINFNDYTSKKTDDKQYCSICKKWDDTNNFYFVKNGKYRSYKHKPCTIKYNMAWIKNKKVEKQ